MPAATRLILASASARRTDLLQAIGVEHEIIPAHDVVEINEDDDLAPSELVEYNARSKAGALVACHPDAVILGADTLVFLDEQALGKPANLSEAQRMLLRLSGRTHQVITGVCLAGPGPGRLRVFHAVTEVKFRVLTATEIAQYIKDVDVMDKAGSYALQDQGNRLVESVHGSASNVIGLPLEALQQQFIQADMPQFVGKSIPEELSTWQL